MQFAVKMAIRFEQGTIYTTEHHVSVVIFNMCLCFDPVIDWAASILILNIYIDKIFI